MGSIPGWRRSPGKGNGNLLLYSWLGNPMYKRPWRVTVHWVTNIWTRLKQLSIHTVQFSSVTQSWPTLCNPMDCSTTGLPVHHQLQELAQTHAYQVSDAIQPSHPLSSLLFLPSTFPSIRVFSNESVLPIRWPKYWSFSFSISPSNEYSGLNSFRIDCLNLLAVKGLK